LGTQVAPRGTTVQVVHRIPNFACGVHTECLARMPNLVADSDTENPPYLCGFRKIASEAPFHRTFSTNMRARSSWQSPGVGKLNTKTTGQTKRARAPPARPPPGLTASGGRTRRTSGPLVCPVVLVFNFPTWDLLF